MQHRDHAVAAVFLWRYYRLLCTEASNLQPFYTGDGKILRNEQTSCSSIREGLQQLVVMKVREVNVTCVGVSRQNVSEGLELTLKVEGQMERGRGPEEYQQTFTLLQQRAPSSPNACAEEHVEDGNQYAITLDHLTFFSESQSPPPPLMVDPGWGVESPEYFEGNAESRASNSTFAANQQQPLSLKDSPSPPAKDTTLNELHDEKKDSECLNKTLDQNAVHEDENREVSLLLPQIADQSNVLSLDGTAANSNLPEGSSSFKKRQASPSKSESLEQSCSTMQSCPHSSVEVKESSKYSKESESEPQRENSLDQDKGVMPPPNDEKTITGKDGPTNNEFGLRKSYVDFARSMPNKSELNPKPIVVSPPPLTTTTTGSANNNNRTTGTSVSKNQRTSQQHKDPHYTSNNNSSVNTNKTRGGAGGYKDSHAMGASNSSTRHSAGYGGNRNSGQNYANNRRPHSSGANHAGNATEGGSGGGRAIVYHAFVKGLPPNATEEEVRKLFAAGPQVQNVKVESNHSASTRQFAFVCFDPKSLEERGEVVGDVVKKYEKSVLCLRGHSVTVEGIRDKFDGAGGKRHGGANNLSAKNERFSET